MATKHIIEVSKFVIRAHERLVGATMVIEALDKIPENMRGYGFLMAQSLGLNVVSEAKALYHQEAFRCIAGAGLPVQFAKQALMENGKMTVEIEEQPDMLDSDDA